MSVFRSNPRTHEADPGRYAETRGEGADLLKPDAPREGVRPAAQATPPTAATAPSATSSFPPFAEREVRAMPTEADKCANVIAAGSKWSGSLNVDDSVRIEGQLSGEVNAKGTVHIAEGARVDAKVRAAFVVVSGAFKGEVRCSERLELMPKSRLEGQIITKVLNVHEGAVVDATIQMTAERDAAGRSRETSERTNGVEALEPAPARAKATSA